MRATRSLVSVSMRQFRGKGMPRYTQEIDFGTMLLGKNRRERDESISSVDPLQIRSFHSTVPRESITPVVVGVGVAAVALTGKYALDAWDAYKQRREDGKPLFGNVSFGSSFYKGGFKEDMDRREAALILGLRESADKKRIQAHHRRLLRLNHPDTGGSTFIATKINEAKDQLLKN